MGQGGGGAAMAAGKGAGRGGEDNNGDVRIATAVDIEEPPPLLQRAPIFSPHR